jgi:uncharacterized YccA/Bax inhibitor family protein
MNSTDDQPFRDELFDDLHTAGTCPPMTMKGTIDKALFLILIVSVSAALTWTYIPGSVPFMLGAVFCAFVVGFATSFRTSISPVTAPLFALLEGAFLGGFSGWMETLYPGIVLQALILTFCVFIFVLALFRARIISATEKFRSIVIGATGGIIIFYLGGIVLAAIGISFGTDGVWGWLGLVFSIAVVIVAAASLVLDLDYIEQGVGNGLPKRHEWYAAFTLLVTMIWLYLEILKLLVKLRILLQRVRS